MCPLRSVMHVKLLCHLTGLDLVSDVPLSLCLVSSAVSFWLPTLAELESLGIGACVSVCPSFPKEKGPVCLCEPYQAPGLLVSVDSGCACLCTIKSLGHRPWSATLEVTAQPHPAWSSNSGRNQSREEASELGYLRPYSGAPTSSVGEATWLVKSKPCVWQQLYATLSIYSMFLWERRRRTRFWMNRDSGSFSDFKDDKCSFAEHVAYETPAGFWEHRYKRKPSQYSCLVGSTDLM